MGRQLIDSSYDGKKTTGPVAKSKRSDICFFCGPMCYASKSDIIYRRLILSSFFSKGWGDVKIYERLLKARKVVSDRTKVNALIPSDYPVELTKSWTKDACYIAEGHFISPLAEFFPGLLPKESENAHFQIIVPKKWPQNGRKPLCLHLAGTGDHYFWRRRNLMAKPLVKEHGIASILLENPFYGVRKPNNQLRSSLRHVADLFVMGAALILESHVLLHWSHRQGYSPLGITGISMGGHMASLACTAWPEPLAIVPCLSWSTASSVFTQGVMSKACAWSTLERQLLDEHYRKNLLKNVAINGDAFTQFDEDLLRDGLIETDYHWNTSPQSYLENDRKNLDENGVQTLYLQHDHIYNNVKSNFLDYLPSFLRKTKGTGTWSTRSKTVDFMNFVMDEATHLKNFPQPVDSSLVRFVVAKHDAYIPRDNIASPCDIWPGCSVQYINGGHVAASLNHQGVFRRVIKEVFDQLQ